MSAFMLAARRSPLMWAVLPLIVLEVLVISGRDSSWIGIWPRASAAAQIPAYYLGPILAGFQAWASGKNRRDDMTSDRYPTARSDVAKNRTELLVGIAAASIVYSAGCVYILVENLTHNAPAGFIWWSYYLLGVSLVLMGVAGGHVIGLAVPGTWTAPVLATAAMFVFSATVANSLDFFVLNGDAWLQLSVPGVACRFAVAVGLLAVATLFPRDTLYRFTPAFRGLVSRAPNRGLVAGVVLTGVCFGVVGADGAVQLDRPAPVATTCTSAAPKICLWADDAKYLPLAKQMHDGMTRLPPGRFTLPAGFYETGLSVPRGAVSFSTSGGRLWSAANDLAVAVGSATYPSTCVPNGASAQQAFTMANYNVLAYLVRSIYGADRPAGEGGGPPVDQAMISRVVRSSTAAQVRWLESQNKMIYAAPCHEPG